MLDSQEVVFESNTSTGRVDYLLKDNFGRVLSVLEAKREDLDPYDAKEQARGYAENLRAPFVILSNGQAKSSSTVTPAAACNLRMAIASRAATQLDAPNRKMSSLRELPSAGAARDHPSSIQCVHQGVSAVSDALQLVEKIRSDLKPLEEKILGHPYLHALQEGRVPLDSLKVFAGQQHHIISSDLRSIALLLSREGMRPSRNFLMNVLQGETAALDALHAFAGALGLRISDLERFEPLPAAHAYCTFVAWLALYGSDAELASAFLVNFPAWGANCGRMRTALHGKYGVAPSALALFELFAGMPSFEKEAIAIIQNALDRGLPAQLIHRAARMLQGYELMFWDAMAGVAGVRLDRGE